MPRSILIEFRRDTAAHWTATNPVLAAGEPGWETDTGNLKIGDGSTAWAGLAYFGAGTISRITAAGGTLTVTNPTGPTANVDMPTTGVTPGAYGDGSHVPQVTVDAEGRVTALTTTGVTGGTGTIGYEIGYDQITSTVNVTSTNEAAGTAIISCAAHTFDGGPVLCEVFAPAAKSPAVAGPGTNFMIVSLFEGATQIGRLWDLATNLTAPAGNQFSILSPMDGKLRFTPSAASHTYTVTAFVNSTTGTPQIVAGAGGTGAYAAAYCRFTKV